MALVVLTTVTFSALVAKRGVGHTCAHFPRRYRVPSYRALTGLNYPPNKRVEAGDIVSDLPEKSALWLLKDGFIQEIDKSPKKIAAPAPAAVKAPSIPAPVEEGEE